MAKTAYGRGGAKATKSSTFKVSVLRCRKTSRVLFLEAGKDFVDTLFSFLVLPIGTIIHMLSNAGGQVKVLNRGISSIFDSVEKLDCSFLHVEKKSLMQPRPAVAGTCVSTGLLQGLEAAERKRPSKESIDLPKVYYRCNSGQTCRVLSVASGTRCATCNYGQCCYNQPMTIPPAELDTLKEKILKAFVEEESNDVVANATCSTGQGFVRENITYMVTDSLEVMPSTTIRSIQVLNKLKVATLADLENTDINVGITQVALYLFSSSVFFSI
ncbi:hypothetical protein KC19_11G028500 [Ceratodon purpureus]|uniref:Uncharacterized protein n=1 Tax=Ceratodon purpureus TaxID=3225 RepID=A0A8T0GDG6_CERPU|nr:hypothetical protein KC19_11G028500 [Ceratodon purpureus]